MPAPADSNCGNCKFFDAKTGECHIRAPTLDAFGRTLFPKVIKDTHCWEWVKAN